MHWLCVCGDASCGHRYVKEYGLDPNIIVQEPAGLVTKGRVEAGMSALHVAILEDQYEMVQMLNKVGANLLHTDAEVMRALIM